MKSPLKEKCRVCGEPAVAVEYEKVEVTLGPDHQTPPRWKPSTSREFAQGAPSYYCLEHAPKT